MWVVVHFLNEDSVETVPETWYRRKERLCAWPISKNSAKRLIEKRIYPNKLDFQWLPARILGKKYGTLEEARAKANKAIFLSDLSASDDYTTVKNTIKRKIGKAKSELNEKIESPPTLMICKTNKTRNVTNFVPFQESEDEIMYDSDKDPEYKQSMASNGDNHIPNNNTKKIENTGNLDFSLDVSIENNIAAHQTLESPTYFVEPTSKIPSSGNHLSMQLMALQSGTTAAIMSQPSTSTQESVNIEDYPKHENNSIMDIHDFQKLVLSSLAKIKYELSVLNTTVHSSQTTINSLDTFLHNTGQSIAAQMSNSVEQANSPSLSDMFPLKNQEDLDQFENKLKDTIYRNNTISKLSVLIGIKDVGDSVRRLTSQMFADELLCEYSLQGFKKKKNFSRLMSYRLLIDTIRVHPKFKNKRDKEIDIPLAVWLTHAKYRMM